MAHRTLRSSYDDLADRLNRHPQGAPPSELLFSILEMLFSAREAELVARLPIRSVDVATAARVWQMPEAEAEKVLDELASRAVLLDVDRDGLRTFLLPPPMAGFFEFSMMRVRDDLDQKALAELYFEYLNVEEDFIKALFCTGETHLGRVFVNEQAVSPEHSLHVLDYERASHIARTASAIAIGLCYCRHKMQHMDRACSAPLEICMTFNNPAASLIKHGHARRVDVAECLDLLQQARDLGLVQFGENNRENVAFICNCCGCCCEALLAARRFGHLHPVHTTNFIPEITSEDCTGCGKCVNACPVEALALISANDPTRPKRRRALLHEELCLGCGVCVRACTEHNITLAARGERVLTPVDSAHRSVLAAIEQGMLHDLIFSNRALWSHRAMAAILGVILALPPAKQILANKQLQSRYLETLVRRYG